MKPLKIVTYNVSSYNRHELVCMHKGRHPQTARQTKPFMIAVFFLTPAFQVCNHAVSFLSRKYGKQKHWACQQPALCLNLTVLLFLCVIYILIGQWMFNLCFSSSSKGIFRITEKVFHLVHGYCTHSCISCPTWDFSGCVKTVKSILCKLTIWARKKSAAAYISYNFAC